jgi:hypothetical protein
MGEKNYSVVKHQAMNMELDPCILKRWIEIVVRTASSTEERTPAVHWKENW